MSRLTITLRMDALIKQDNNMTNTSTLKENQTTPRFQLPEWVRVGLKDVTDLHKSAPVFIGLGFVTVGMVAVGSPGSEQSV